MNLSSRIAWVGIAGVLTASVAIADITNITQGTTHPSIQDAIDQSVDGDEIVVDPGEYAESINLLGRQITLRSQDPLDDDIVASTIISGDGTSTFITCSSGETADTVISGFLITGFNGWIDTVMRIQDAGPTVTRCVFSHFHDYLSTRLVLSTDGSPTFEHCSFMSSVASGDGSEAHMFGLYVVRGSATVRHCSFEGLFARAAQDHGFVMCEGIHISAADVCISDCDFAGITASGPGGFAHASAIVLGNHPDSKATIERCRITAVVASSTTFDDGLGYGVRSSTHLPASNVTISDSIIGCHSHAPVYGNYTDGGGNSFSDHFLPPADNGTTCPEDINGDGVVDLSDLGALLAVFEQNCP